MTGVLYCIERSGHNTIKAESEQDEKQERKERDDTMQQPIRVRMR